MMSAMVDCRKQQPQLIMMNIGGVVVRVMETCWKIIMKLQPLNWVKDFFLLFFRPTFQSFINQ